MAYYSQKASLDHRICPCHRHQEILAIVRLTYTYTAWHVPDKHYSEVSLNIVQNHLFTIIIANGEHGKKKYKNTGTETYRI